jgi:alkylated DNA repair dioxygenase AlkB
VVAGLLRSGDGPLTGERVFAYACGMSTTSWQGSLLDAVPGEPLSPRERLADARREELPHGAWVEHREAWVPGADGLFAALLDALPWRQRREPIRGELVDQPRLTAHLAVDEVSPGLAVLTELADALGERYGREFVRIGCNLYRDGNDSVTWHGDRVLRDRREAVVAIVSLGETRTLRLKPAEGGNSLGYRLARGDLLVMGGTCQRTWRHAVPKVVRAGPRISVTFRHR